MTKQIISEAGGVADLASVPRLSSRLSCSAGPLTRLYCTTGESLSVIRSSQVAKNISLKSAVIREEIDSI